MSKCVFKNCNSNKIRARGLCAKHWNYQQYGGCINGCRQPASRLKGLCNNCIKRNGKPPKTRRDGTCGKCGLSLDKDLRCKRCRTRQNKNNNLKRRYKIDLNQWESIFEEQKQSCKICKKDSKRFVVDHDHKCCSTKETCGKCIRGIICENCNRALGLIKDSTTTLKNMINYLEKREVL